MSGLRFRVLGIPVHVEPVFFLIAFLLGGIGRPGILVVSFVVVVFVSVLFHELAHAVAFRAFGRSPSIVLHGLGGLTGAPGPPLPRGRDIVVSAVGPLSQIIVLGIPALMFRLPVARAFESVEVYQILTDAAWVNVGWGVLNLVPILPLDGGRIAAGVLGGRRNGMRLAHGLSVAVATAGGIWAVARGRYFLAVWAAMFAGMNLKGMQDQRDAPHAQRIHDGHRAVEARDHGAAIAAAEEVMGAARAAPVRAAAVELAAWAHLARGDVTGAQAILARLPEAARPTGYVGSAIALAQGDRDTAVAEAARGYHATQVPPPNTRLVTGLAEAGLLDDVTERVLASHDEARGDAVARLTQSLHDAKQFAAAAALARRQFESGEDRGVAAYNVACGLSRLGDRPGALEWLVRAIDNGFARADLLDADPDLDQVRDTAEFRAIRARVAGAAPHAG